MPGPLDGIRILDLTTVLLGPYCTQTLGDMGADIIKIEPPQGDSTRFIGPTKSKGMGGTFLNISRNKKSCVIDLKRKEALSLLERLLPTMDVLIYNMRPAAMERLGITYDWVRSINPKIIYCGALGYGETGPYAGRPAFDDIIQAASGMTAYQQISGGKPEYSASAVADKVTGMATANAILGALVYRMNSGRGQIVNVSMFETMVGFTLVEHMTGMAFDPPLGSPIYSRVVSPNRRPYETLDGYIAVLPYNDAQWSRFFGLIGQPEMSQDPRYVDMAARTENIDSLYAIVIESIRLKTSRDWIGLLEDSDIPAMELMQPDDYLSDPHLCETGFFHIAEHDSEGRIRMTSPIASYSESEMDIRSLAPRLGQHTIEILKEAGIGDTEISKLRRLNVVMAEQDFVRPDLEKSEAS